MPRIIGLDLLMLIYRYYSSFDFNEMRIDEALRIFVEAFRLPGESPLISLVMQHFADHWQVGIYLCRATMVDLVLFIFRCSFLAEMQ